MISVGAPSVGSEKLSRVTRDTCGYARNIDALEGLVKLVSAVIVYFEQTDRISLVVQVERRVRVICNSAMSTTKVSLPRIKARRINFLIPFGFVNPNVLGSLGNAKSL